MTKEETKALVERVRKAKNRRVMSEFIRIGQSDLYDWQETRRAVLKEIAFLQVNDENTKVPEHSPFKGRYEGWCYASQRYLACRIGSSERWIRDCVKRFEKDGVIETREWRDHLGYLHKEYHVKEDVVTEHQRQEDYLEENRDRPRRGGNKAANKGSFKKNWRKERAQSHRNGQPSPQEESAICHRNSHASAIGTVSHEAIGSVTHPEMADTAVEDVDFQDEALSLRSSDPEGFSSATATIGRALASAAAPQRDEKGAGLPLSYSQKQKPTGTVIKEERKPLPNRLCYPEAFKAWKPGMRLPRCKRCDGLLPPNENHVCEGYMPKLPFEDMEDHMEFMDIQRESMREEIHARHDARREEKFESMPDFNELEELEEQDAEF